MHSYTEYGIMTSKRFLIHAAHGNMNQNFFDVRSIRDINVIKKFCIKLLIRDECIFDYLNTPTSLVMDKRASVYA